MSNTIHAFDFLDSPNQHGGSDRYVLFGDDRFLQLLVRKQLLLEIGGDDAEFNTTIYEGDSATPLEIQDNLMTVSLFDQTHGRIVVVDQADGFVKKYRDELERICDQDFQNGHLVLSVTTWPSNTRLYKSFDKKGCQIHCGEPKTQTKGRSKSVDTKRICKWISERAKREHGLDLPQAPARQLLELVEGNLGRAEQELIKLSLLVDRSKAVDADMVRSIVGGWRAHSIWQAAQDAVDGETASALTNISRLLQSGEHPLALYGQLAWSLRRYGRVWEVIGRQLRAGRKSDLSVALREAGFRPYNDEMSLADSALKQLGRHRVKEIYRQLLRVDLSLKGTHSDDRRARLALEMLFAGMSKQLASPGP